MSNFVSALSAHETSWHSLPMDSNSNFRIHRTSFQSIKIHEFREKKKINAFQVNFSEFNNKLVTAFTTNGVENSVFSLPHILLFALDAKKYFYYISSVLSGVMVLKHGASP